MKLKEPEIISDSEALADTPYLRPQSESDGRITFRSIVLGLAGSALIAATTYYNDYVMANTPMIGNNLPTGVVILLFSFTFLINGPLSRFAPRWRFSTSEVAIIFSMILISCAIPSSGMMRQLPGTMIGPLWYAQSNHEFGLLMERMNLPSWLMPTITRPMHEAMSDPIVSGFYGRWHADNHDYLLAWMTPVLYWSIFIFAFFGAILCVMSLVYQQWVHHERLPFPLAQVQLALIEQPRPGRMLNTISRSRLFWLAMGTVFFLHAINGMHQYFPRGIPEIPLSFDFRPVLMDGAWSYVPLPYKAQVVFFTVIGLAYFVSSSVSLSVWFFVVMGIALVMLEGSYTGSRSALIFQRDQHVGAVMAFMLMILWIGRHHGWLILKQAFRGWRQGEIDGPYLSHRMAFWILMACLLIMMGWLYAAGATILGSVIIVLMLMMLYVVSAKLVAETGLLYTEMRTALVRPWQLLVAAGISKPVPTHTFYLGTLIDSFSWQHREPAGGYAVNAMRISEVGMGTSERNRKKLKTGVKIIAALFAALVVSYFVCFASTIWGEYDHAVTIEKQAQSPVNGWGNVFNPYSKIVEPTLQYELGAPPTQVNPVVQVGAGAVVTGILAVLRFAFSWWPLHPVGYLLMPTWMASKFWFSIFLGWLIKVLMVRFGGAGVYTAAKPLFIGFIVGEALATGFWMLVAIVLSLVGIPFEKVFILPL